MRQSLYEYCIEHNRQELLEEWDAEANAQLTPKLIWYGSGKNCHWVCAEGHRWTTKAFTRITYGCGCPTCEGKKIIPGKNDFATLMPETAAEWDSAKNAPLRPETLSPNSHVRAWWKCGKCGYEWQATVIARTGSQNPGCPACASRTVNPDMNDLATLYPQLAAEWHPTKNGDLTPRDVIPGMPCKAWWCCAKGHEWQASVYNRIRGSKCPVCTGKKVLPGVNDLLTLAPDAAAEWDSAKNAPLRPETLSPNSHVKVWWKCSVCGHEWQATVKSRAGSQKTGCPVCANRAVNPGVNDLATLYPLLAGEWHPTKNGDLTPQAVVPGSRRKAWWRCGKGHEWQADISSRIRGSGCPVCMGKKIVPGENDLQSMFPQIAAEWHPTKNGPLSPSDLLPYSNRSAWWLCDKGHEYSSVISSRTQRGSGCPYCANRKVLPGFNDLATLEPKIAAQWHPTLNGTLTPQDVTCGSSHRIWWKCSEGHEWQAIIYSRAGAQKSGCPVCAGKVKRPKQERYRQIVTEKRPTAVAGQPTGPPL